MNASGDYAPVGTVDVVVVVVVVDGTGRGHVPRTVGVVRVRRDSTPVGIRDIVVAAAVADDTRRAD